MSFGCAEDARSNERTKVLHKSRQQMNQKLNNECANKAASEPINPIDTLFSNARVSGRWVEKRMFPSDRPPDLTTKIYLSISLRR